MQERGVQTERGTAEVQEDVVLPYVQGLSEKVARIFKEREVNTAMKSPTTHRILL